jgi:hypothetical protein
MHFGDKIEEVYELLKDEQNIIPHPSGAPFNTKESIDEKLEKIKNRKSTNFTSTISDER